MRGEVGRPSHAYGIWPDMIEAAHGVGKLAALLGMSERQIRRIATGTAGLTGPRAELARAFAAQHGLTLRCYVHPSMRNAYLVSGPTGWWAVPRHVGGWDLRVAVSRGAGDDWSLLGQLEVDFAQAWDSIN